MMKINRQNIISRKYMPSQIMRNYSARFVTYSRGGITRSRRNRALQKPRSRISADPEDLFMQRIEAVYIDRIASSRREY